MADRIKLRRGPKNRIDLNVYELGYVTDSDEERLYFNNGSMVAIPNEKDITDIKTELTEATNISTQNKNDIVELKESVSGIAKTGVAKLVQYSYDIELSENTQRVNIPYEKYSSVTDTLKVYVNGLAIQNDQYTVTDPVENDGIITNGYIMLKVERPAGTIVRIEVWKNVPSGEEGEVSGNIIAQNSLPLNRIIGIDEIKNALPSNEEKEKWNGKVDKTDYKKTVLRVESNEDSTSTQYNITIDNITSIEDIGEITLIPNITCSDAPKIKINDFEANNILNSDNENLSAEDIKSGIPVKLVRVGSNFFYVSLNKKQSSSLSWVNEDTFIVNPWIGMINGINHGLSSIICEMYKDDLYIFETVSSSKSNKAFKYNFKTNILTPLNDILSGFDNRISGLTLGNNCIYATMKSDSISYLNNYMIAKYDILLDTWTHVTNIPHSMGYMSIHYLNDKLYVYQSDDNYMDVYDITLNTWTCLASPRIKRTGVTTILNDDKIFVIGGHERNNDSTAKNTKLVTMYDITLNAWTTLAESPLSDIDETSSINSRKLVYKNYIFAYTEGVTQTTQIYDIRNNKWIQDKSPKNVAYSTGCPGIIYGDNLLLINTKSIKYIPVLDLKTLLKNNNLNI